MLGGVEWKTVWDKGRGEGEDEEKELGREEFKKAVNRMKNGKALRGDGIAIKYRNMGGENVEQSL